MKIGFFKKLKLEITVVLILILAIVAFFIYAKVVNVMTAAEIKAQTEISEQISESLSGINSKLHMNNCLIAANGDQTKIDGCVNGG
ncbi:hypothetical protein ACFL3T_03615 [Patescibacteria group bacterium]